MQPSHQGCVIIFLKFQVKLLRIDQDIQDYV